ncbi:hypothetical protein XarjCFBP7653_03160 [Xanthomonas arboricola]|nr:hypothetical protein XarjCFBP7653_03160 [Xanthomonas arboricola]
MHAYRRGTRRKYVLVGSGAASMPLKVPHRHARKHRRLLSVAEKNAKRLPSCRRPNRTATTRLLTCVGRKSADAWAKMPCSLMASTVRATAP